MNIFKYINTHTKLTFTGRFRQACVSAFAICCIQDHKTTAEELETVRYMLDNVRLKDLDQEGVLREFEITLGHLKTRPDHIKKHRKILQEFKGSDAAGSIMAMCLSICESDGLDPKEVHGMLNIAQDLKVDIQLFSQMIKNK
jgi:tellurite resistance protein